jgi:hypothetical protein
MNVFPTLPLIVALLGQVPPPPSPDKPEAAPVRLDFMKKAVTLFTIHPADDRSKPFRLLPDPIIRFNNPVGRSRDGAIFLWLGEHDRPEVADQFNVISSGFWGHQFSSLSARPLVAENRFGPVWSPRRGGVEYKTVPDAPRPAEAAEPRLRQMRALAETFSVIDDFQGEGWQRLRLMTRPMHRYGKPGTEVIDGAVFCFALTTDPEAFLILEARAGKEDSGWHYAIAPITVYGIKASYKEKEVWSAEGFGYDNGPTGMIVQVPYDTQEAGR